MPIQEYENVKGFTFVQSTEPAESKSKEHDTWYNTSNNKVYMFQNYRWKMYVNAIYFPGADYGYICGGNEDYDNGPYLSTIERITFPFDSGTATHVGNLSSSRNAVTSCCNSSNYGYVCGGSTKYTGAPYFSTIDRFSFPFDSGTASHVGNLSESKARLGSCNSSVHGYICGGYNGDPVYRFSTIERFSFPFDSGTATHVGNLTDVKDYSSACNSSNYGYNCGGSNGAGQMFSIVERFSFPFDSGTSTHVGNLSYTTHALCSCNSSNYGYCAGCYIAGNLLSTIDRFAFPFDSGTATHVGNLSGSRCSMASCNSSDYGYICGGVNSSNYLSLIDRITFPFNSGTATHVGNLTGSRDLIGGIDGTDFITLFDNLSSRVYV